MESVMLRMRFSSFIKEKLTNEFRRVSPQPYEDKEHVTDNELFVPPGHFYSPIVDTSELNPWPSYEPLNEEIEINKIEMLDLMAKISVSGLVFPRDKISQFRYYSNNDQYAEGDAFTYSGILSQLMPKKIIEIGSGYSTAVVLDWIENQKQVMDVDLIVIEPYPERLKTLVKPDDTFTLIAKKVQLVDLKIFEQLQENDILFIDSSHVGKSGSDVLFELFKILPLLKSGVWVHFHYCFWPFEYPEAWVVKDNRSWNELHFLRAFLAYNKSFKIKFFNHYLALNSNEWHQEFPSEIQNPGGALWVMKC